LSREEDKLKRIFVPKRGGGWRKFHSEEFRKLYSSENIITAVKSIAMRWVRYVARMAAV
jgi:hypothetical protein